MPSIALATYQSFRGMELGPLSERSEIGLLKSNIEKELISFAGYEATVQGDQVDGCKTLAVGDRPARYYLDLFPSDVVRGHPQVIAFEDVLADTFDPARVRDKIVLVGRQADRVDVAYLWNRGPRATHGVNVHAGAINTLLSQQFITRMGAPEQLAWLCLLALGAAAIRTEVEPRRSLRRALLLVLLVVVDLAFAVLCSLRGLITDLPYQLLVIFLSYRLSGRMGGIWLNVRDLVRRTRVTEPARG
jgi:CHASE2 domain-containing sensor protein